MNRDTLFGSIIIALFLISIAVTIQKPSRTDESSAKSSALFSKKGIAIVDINGPISFPSHSTTYYPMGADAIMNQLEAIREDKNVMGVVLRINSPGGTVGASQELYHMIKRIKSERNIPIVSQIGDLGASGGYYAALGSDVIFANPGSLVGSIGVIISHLSLEELAKKYGISHEVYKSGAYKDLFSMWRPSTDGEQKMLQALVDNVHGQFVTAFQDSRNLSESKALTLAQGQIFTGEQALEAGIIDELGGYYDALAYIGELTGLGQHPPIISKSSPNVMDFINRFKNMMFTPFSGTMMIPPVIQ